MDSKKTIGELIEYEVRKQGFEITEFAKKIKCKRNNVYNIFKRNNLDIALLARISEVLEHNYFADIAKDYSLVEYDEEESKQDEGNRKAVNQFMEVVPNVLKELGKKSTIAFGGIEDSDLIYPDFVLPDYCITFTIGKTWAEKANIFSNDFFAIQPITNGKISFFYIVNKIGTPVIDIKLEYKSYDEWKEMLSFVFQKFPNLRFEGYGRRL